jgi:hypothetical protein
MGSSARSNAALPKIAAFRNWLRAKARHRVAPLSPLVRLMADRDQGFGPKRVQALMGQSTIQMTFDTYGSLFPQEDDAERFAAGELVLVG